MGRWLSPRVVLSVDKGNGTVAVPGSGLLVICVAVEGTRLAIIDDPFVIQILVSIKAIDDVIMDAAEHLYSVLPAQQNSQYQSSILDKHPVLEQNFSDRGSLTESRRGNQV